MPDFVLFAKAILVSAVVAGLTLLCVAWPARTAGSRRLSAGWILGLGAGIYAGCGILNEWPRWPPTEDRDRFLTILLPLTLVVETVGEFAQSHRLAWLLRLSLAAAAAPILLYDSVYLVDRAGPQSTEWSTAEAAGILLVLAALLVGVWGLLVLLQSRTSDRAAAPLLVLTSLAAGITVMLSGYYRGGLLGLPLAGALAGATLASFAAGPDRNTGSHYLGIATIGTFTVLVIGRFFGSLPSSAALCLMLAPLLAWIAELPAAKRLWPRARAALRLICVAVPLMLIITRAQTKFTEASAARSKPTRAAAAERVLPEK